MAFYAEKKQLGKLCFRQDQLHLTDLSPLLFAHQGADASHTASHYKTPVTLMGQIAVSEVCHFSVRWCVVSHVQRSRAGTRFTPTEEVCMGFQAFFSHIALFISI